MPRVCLTMEQRDAAMVDDMSRAVLDTLNAKKGVERKKEKDFAPMIGLCRAQWNLWNRGSIKTATFEKVLIALNRCGYRLAIVPKATKGG